MSQGVTLQLLPQTTYANPGNGAPYTVIGNAQPAAAYYLGNQSLQTVNLSTAMCTGNIIIEASLASKPTDTDWFQVYMLETANTDTSTYTNIVGTFVYMRARIEDFSYGAVNYINLSY
jgi:hypothetical protein